MSTSSSSPILLTPEESPIPRCRTRDAENTESKTSDVCAIAASLHTAAHPSPKVRLHLQDLTDPATKTFINLIADPNAAINTALANIVTYLYTSPPKNDQTGTDYAQSTRPHFKPSLPGTRSVTLILRDKSGVAYTTGTDLDPDHKEIHISLSYISKVSKTFEDPTSELLGVITHELVHCYQHSRPRSYPKNEKKQKGKPAPEISSPPSGLIEGIADFVRLKAGLVPPHWKRPMNKAERGSSWHQGYQSTAFFLEWIEDVKVGKGAVGMLNDRMLRTGYVGESDLNADENDEKGEEGEGQRVMMDGKKPAKLGFWHGLFGAEVLELWEEYGEYLDSSKMN
ncbi:PBSP domain-containing protein [Paracoccidioides lutzii Pb01]|uniref:PBSP domain-containing protein n=1 Tax=Paracoccidioides lutzii (strain ATCC MYA-826 / Pb01) TaxID=502779 RepID=C1HA09_PARBA|nr:PBSP domain-containing protein [Paracoccidioides lutzii Pb01]EEH37182.1 PBSP domain-containing protein [Paracoccidioides lutzii Pb01]